jgi:hypothetical protein
MRHVYVISINPELEAKLDSYQELKGYETRSEGAMKLLKMGLNYEDDIAKLKSEIDNQSNINQIHIPCFVCHKPLPINESDDDPIYKDIKKRYSKIRRHATCKEPD